MALGFGFVRAMLEQPAHITTAESPSHPNPPLLPSSSQHLPLTHPEGTGMERLPRNVEPVSPLHLMVSGEAIWAPNKGC